ncbi:hypothetical protein PVL29_009172 [Vitis rotundifolia]|uniref:Myb-like domain-containing protein n=1 Tax=Vitis rotundifolia TaxID=103349 RepID=A0AA38ZXW9_VITRO|nr:hypothetical protein PVL29_009172 [Vitis rotundifolia]
MATPSPPPPSSSPPNRPKKAQPLPWSHQETTHLIQAYQEKWYSLKRGQLKASQWEEVAVTVAARCNYDEPSKSATQCRHKIEKLRKRYRAEKQRIVIGAAASSSWPYFHLMDSLERGPLPISAQPMSVLKYEKAYPYSHNCKPNDDNVGNDDYSNSSNDEDSGALKTRSRSINYILQRPAVVNRFAVDPKLNWSTEREETGAVVVEGGNGVVWELAGEMRAFAERFVRMETMKMEMMKETERRRMEMESRRMEMIVESQRKIVETIERALGSNKKLKMSQEI